MKNRYMYVYSSNDQQILPCSQRIIYFKKLCNVLEITCAVGSFLCIIAILFLMARFCKLFQVPHALTGAHVIDTVLV